MGADYTSSYCKHRGRNRLKFRSRIGTKPLGLRFFARENPAEAVWEVCEEYAASSHLSSVSHESCRSNYANGTQAIA